MPCTKPCRLSDLITPVVAVIALRVLRALQLLKAVLLEGCSGMGGCEREQSLSCSSARLPCWRGALVRAVAALAFVALALCAHSCLLRAS